MNATARILSAFVSLLITSSTAVLAQSTPEFKADFEDLASQIPEVVGMPIEDEHFTSNGDALQRTTRGLMVWRKTDNWVAFTDGCNTWIDGPYGLQSRDNETRFSWETPAATPPVLPQTMSVEEEYARSVVLALADLPPGYTLDAGRSGVTSNETQAKTWPDPAEAMARFSENGRVIGYEASYTTDDPETVLAGSFVAIVSAASIYGGAVGAHRAFSSEGLEPSEWVLVPAPRVGDESIAQIRIVEGSTFDVMGYKLTFRRGRTYCQIIGVGLALSIELESIVNLARVMESRAESESLSQQ